MTITMNSPIKIFPQKNKYFIAAKQKLRIIFLNDKALFTKLARLSENHKCRQGCALKSNQLALQNPRDVK